MVLGGLFTIAVALCILLLSLRVSMPRVSAPWGRKARCRVSDAVTNDTYRVVCECWEDWRRHGAPCAHGVLRGGRPIPNHGEIVVDVGFTADMGQCTRARTYMNGYWRTSSARIQLGDLTRDVIRHEMGHALGIRSHTNLVGNVMSARDQIGNSFEGIREAFRDSRPPTA